jgi:hypothetical protein
MNPKWITWDRDGECWLWTRRPAYFPDEGGIWDMGSMTGAEEAHEYNHKRGGPKAIRRIRLEKP